MIPGIAGALLSHDALAGPIPSALGLTANSREAIDARRGILGRQKLGA